MILVNQETLLSCHVSRRSAKQETLFPSHVSRIKLWRNQETLLRSRVSRRWANQETTAFRPEVQKFIYDLRYVVFLFLYKPVCLNTYWNNLFPPFSLQCSLSWISTCNKNFGVKILRSISFELWVVKYCRTDLFGWSQFKRDQAKYLSVSGNPPIAFLLCF
jgi:hypothetical protein